MIRIIADNITSPLGMTTQQNYENVRQGHSRLMRYDHFRDISEPFAASLFSDEQWSEMLLDDSSCFESLIIHSIREALRHADIDVSSPRVLFVLSTTKGNVELLDSRCRPLRGRDVRQESGYVAAASHIARHFGNPNTPVLVSNACISGLAAQIVAKRALESGRYDYAVVAGGDVQSRFIISGFQSFKAISVEACRPFDIERLGMNPGEAAATLIMAREKLSDSRWTAVEGAMRNDAFHVTSPSKTAEGCYRVLERLLRRVDRNDLAMVSVHGTSTMFNDEMESVALFRAHLSDVPVNSVKGYYGHTMGAAGILESILTMKALDDGIILATRGFEERGVSKPVNISGEERTTDKHDFIKLVSGFGGSNGAMYYHKEK